MPAIKRSIAHTAHLALFLEQFFYPCTHDQVKGGKALGLARHECEETGLGHERNVGELGFQVVQIELQS